MMMKISELNSQLKRTRWTEDCEIMQAAEIGEVVACGWCSRFGKTVRQVLRKLNPESSSDWAVPPRASIYPPKTENIHPHRNLGVSVHSSSICVTEWRKIPKLCTTWGKLNNTELYTLKWLIVCYVTCASIF